MNSRIAIPNYQFYDHQVTLEDFELIRCIGHGAYGQVVYSLDILLGLDVPKTRYPNSLCHENTNEITVNEEFYIKSRNS